MYPYSSVVPYIFSGENNYSDYNVWDEITFPLSNFNGCTTEIWEEISNVSLNFTENVITYWWSKPI